MTTTIIHQQLSDRVIGLALTVHHILGPGLLESAYEDGMCWELSHSGIPFDRQKVFPLCYKGDYISAYFADLVVNNAIILELKAVQAFNPAMQAQLINYLKLSKVPVGYLINFYSTNLEWQRFVYKRE
jgi:GxxExxY protein